MSYLLDTNAAIAIINGTPAGVRNCLRAAIERAQPVAISSISLFELQYGVAKSTRTVENAERLGAFLRGPIDIVPFDDADAELAGTIRARLEAIGKPIGPYDLLIGAQAVRLGWTLITANQKEFNRIQELRIESWI